MEQKKDDELMELIKKLNSTVREFGSFSARIDGELNLVVSADIGWSITYPFASDTWAYMVNWFEVWDEDSKTSFETYIKAVAFPCSTRLKDIDEEYIRDILSAHMRLSERAKESGIHDDNLSEEESMKDLEDAGVLPKEEADGTDGD